MIGIDIDTKIIVQEQDRVFDQTLIVIFFAGLASILLGYLFGNLLTNSIEKFNSGYGKICHRRFLGPRADIRKR